MKRQYNSITKRAFRGKERPRYFACGHQRPPHIMFIFCLLHVLCFGFDLTQSQSSKLISRNGYGPNWWVNCSQFYSNISETVLPVGILCELKEFYCNILSPNGKNSYKKCQISTDVTDHKQTLRLRLSVITKSFYRICEGKLNNAMKRCNGTRETVQCFLRLSVNDMNEAFLLLWS